MTKKCLNKMKPKGEKKKREEKKYFKPVCASLKKGQASFHHSMAVHGSYGNR